ncbi:hypothetical protein [Nesterenkonia rhizosphaerae]|uniref:Uncharacterized protein n=1 Tax=Nesterenkonia rhizosphaerae TaxID=1348272 RepID=A0ABP9FZI3_9MICC
MTATLQKRAQDCDTPQELQALFDHIMNTTAEKVQSEWTPPAPPIPGTTYTPLALGLLKQNAQKEAQIAALEAAGFTDAHMDKMSGPRPAVTRTADEIEQWRATRERSARRKAEKARRRADKLEAAVKRDEEARGPFDHGHLNIPRGKRPGLSIDSAIDHAAALHEARRDAEHHESRANYWATWTPKDNS